MTPLMKQYYKIKEQHKDKILFFRMGDFFEMFDKDAETAAPILNIALTYRNKKSGLDIKMCGLPHHSISSPISKLLDKGFHVAICDQCEGEFDESGLVKRAVTRVLSPGMVYDLDSLDGSNYLCAFDKNTLAFLDISTGSAFYYEFSSESDFLKLIEQFQPTELVVTEKQKKNVFIPPEFNLSLFDKPLTAYDSSLPVINTQSPTHHVAPLEKDYPRSVRRLLCYVRTRQGEECLKTLSSFEKKSLQEEMYYSSQLYSHLEVFKNYEGGKKDTLFATINRSKTPHGTRLLKQRLQSPLIDKKELEKRWDRLEWWLNHKECLNQVRAILSSQGDGERRLAKILQPQVNGRDCLALAESLTIGFKVEELLHKNQSPWQAKEQSLNQARLLVDKIKHIISVDAPAQLKEGGVINQGVNPQLDECIRLSKNSQALVLKMEQKEKEELQIPSLKIRYNSVFGYFIEVRKTHNSKVPPHYKRKQTLVQSERYTTEELYQLEQKVLSAKSKRLEWELQIFKDLKEEILDEFSLLSHLFHLWAKRDLYSSLAYLSLENRYVRPQIGARFQLKGSRHPVLEQKSFHDYIPNSVDLDPHQTILLTGPNMAGKSSLMRQFALTILMAQTGCFVPAQEVTLPIFHKLFTRMGASDFLSKGLSTFMVEMKETAEILEKADSQSFILLDELGRGTSTFDGMSLAQSIIEYLTKEKKALVFSATHYQELTSLAKDYDSIRNFSMQIRESEEGIHFLYLLKEKPADKSYGIPVAKLAGLPSSVLERAKELLALHEIQKNSKAIPSEVDGDISKGAFKELSKVNPDETHGEVSGEIPRQNPRQTSGENPIENHRQTSSEVQNELFKFDSSDNKELEELKKEIQDYPLSHKSPIDALNQIKKWQDQILILKKQESNSLKSLKTKPFHQSVKNKSKESLN